MSKSKERGLVSRFFGMIFKKNYATKEVTKEKPVKKVANDAFTAEILNGEPKAEVKKVKSLPVKKYEELDLSEINMTPKRVCGTKAMIQFLHEEFEYSEGHEILYGEFEDEYKTVCEEFDSGDYPIIPMSNLLDKIEDDKKMNFVKNSVKKKK